MPRPSAPFKRLLIFVHRWLGVALSIIFMIWFLSGIVMMYWSYPEVSAADRLQRAPRLDPAQITISPEQAHAALERARDSGPSTALGPVPVRLGSFDGRPVYRFSGGGGRSRAGGAMVYADDGSVQRVVDAAIMDRAASAWAARPRSDATKQPVEDVDQWTVGALRNVRPLFKYSWPDGQQVYVNGNTGEVVQYTTTSSRFWAYLGAIPHWLYFTPLRKHQAEWSSVVVWSSLIGTIAALIGLAIIVWMYSPRKQYRFAGAQTSIPYRGWKRWHAITGLFFGLVTTTWAFSGLLSMGPFPIMNRLTDLTVAASGDTGRGRNGGQNLSNALRGGRAQPLSAYAGRSPREAIAAVPGFDVKELEWTSFAGEPLYLVTNGRGETRLIPIDGDPRASIDPEEVMRVVRGALGEDLDELRVVDEYDAYYLDRRGDRRLPVVYARLNDAVATRYYIDPKTATVVGQYSARGWVNRWLYHGLHSLDFPWLYKYRPLWDIVVIGLMLGGTALCATSLVMTWRVLERKMAAVLRTRIDLPNEDLAS
jgi:uncharacterized iron-regulated membrane protein